MRTKTIDVEKVSNATYSSGDFEFYAVASTAQAPTSINTRIINADNVLENAQAVTNLKAMLPKDYQLFELQDELIQASIKHICQRFNVLYDIVRKNGLHLEPTFRQEQTKWQVRIGELHKNLTNWELEHVGKQTFSSAFECLIDNILVRKAGVA